MADKSNKTTGFLTLFFRIVASLSIPALTLFLLIRQAPPPPWEVPEETAEILKVHTVQEVWDYYESIGYTDEKLAVSSIDVPRIYLDSIVNTWARNETVSSKKSLFYRTMLPLVLRTNELISAKRKHLLFLAEEFRQKKLLNDDDLSWLTNLAVSYRVLKKGRQLDISGELFDTLALRVDTIPVSMALGQMAYESGYATSRFAGEGNALFGQWRWGDGMMPENQREGKGDYRIADFQNPIDSMEAYAKNMNTNRAYTEFRKERAKQRRQGKDDLDGYSLAATLHRYSERRHEYVMILQGIIRDNNLSVYDGARLAQCTPVILVPDLKDS